MRRFWRENSLSLVLLALFLASIIWQYASGYAVYAEDMAHTGETPSTLGYLPHFAHAVMENWQSEFLQVLVYVQLTIYLRQKGSKESKKVDSRNEDHD